MSNKESEVSNLFRLSIIFSSIILPVIFLIKGIYGSFLFTFSIPLIWQVGFMRRPLISLGLKKRFLWRSIAIGFLSGIVLGLFGGNILRSFGITGYALNNLDKLRISLGPLNLSFQLQNELGYRLLTMSSSFKNAFLYLIFCILVVGLGEELLWRGFIQKKMSNLFSKDASICLTAVLFASFHLYIFTIVSFKVGIFLLALIALAGAFWGYLFEYTNNIWSSVVSHGLSAFIIWRYYFFASL